MSRVADRIALGLVFDGTEPIMISPAIVRPNGDAMNSVARGEKSDGVLGVSCMARSMCVGEKTRRLVAISAC